ncbi:tol-pal system YbgF family protein [Capnocytophaga sp. ARDL2]|uniref:type IX secretion system periplasmic lipoprotein PorW/SprE n=1 Tax=Capnocytophaga sp. ARDL2 TaxID=3238809 RepID=UPI003557C1DE
MKNRHIKKLAFGLVALIAIACSTEKTSLANRKYHATTTKYNILYNGDVSYNRGIQMIQKKYKDNFQEILTVEQMRQDEDAVIIADKQDKNPHFQKAEEKAIKATQLHSMYVGGKEYNPQIDQAYMLLGKSRYHDLRFLPAIEAFNYIIMKYPDSEVYYDAILWREKTNLKMKYNDLAVSNIKKLLKNKDVSKEVKSEALATLAQGYINLQYLDSAKIPLKEAIELTNDNEKQARYTYILGQLNAKTDAKDEAFQNFQDVIDFNRKAPRALVINAHAARFQNQDFHTIDTAAFTKEHLSLLNDRENRPYADVIFHQIGAMNDKADNLKAAVKNYNQSLKVGKDNNSLKYQNYANMAAMYYRYKKFETAGIYYDSTMLYINPNSKEYLTVKRKRNNLVDIVKYEKIARENDSLLFLIGMEDAERRTYLQAQLDEKRRLDEEKEAKAKAASSKGKSKVNTAAVVVQSSSFYFYSDKALNKGKEDFKKKYGNRPLADNWRWASRVQSTQMAETTTTEPAKGTKVEDTYNPRDMRYNADFFLAQLPTDIKDILKLKEERDDAYYQLGLLYSDKLEEYDVAINKYETLLTFIPKVDLEQATYYQLYKLYKNRHPEQAQRILDKMMNTYPNSKYTKIMVNPNADISEDGNQNNSYESIYKLYEKGHFVEALQQLDEAIPLVFNDQLIGKYELLRAIVAGKLYGLEEYKKSLQHVATSYPNTNEGKEAQRILSSELPKLQKMEFKNDLTRNLKMVYEVHYPLDAEGKKLKESLERYANERGHTGVYFSADIYSPEKMFLVLHGIRSGNLAKSAQIYLQVEKEYGIKQQPHLVSSHDYALILIKKNWTEYLKKRAE